MSGGQLKATSRFRGRTPSLHRSRRRTPASFRPT